MKIEKIELVQFENGKTYTQVGTDGFSRFDMEYLNSLKKPSKNAIQVLNLSQKEIENSYMATWYEYEYNSDEYIDWKNEKPYRAEYNDMTDYDNDMDNWANKKPSGWLDSVEVFVVL